MALKDLFSKVKSETAEKAKEEVQGLTEEVKEKAEKAAEEIKEKAEDAGEIING